MQNDVIKDIEMDPRKTCKSEIFIQNATEKDIKTIKGNNY